MLRLLGLAATFLAASAQQTIQIGVETNGWIAGIDAAVTATGTVRPQPQPSARSCIYGTR